MHAPALWEAERLRRGSMGGAGGAASCPLPCLRPRPAKTLRPQRSGTSTEDLRGRISGCAQALHLKPLHGSRACLHVDSVQPRR